MNFEQNRENMVDSQINPMGVVEPSILESFLSVPREKFVNPGQEGICYCDEDLPLGGGRYLMEPSVHARLLQHAGLRPDDVVLDIGCGTGYSAAILSPLVSTVIALESDPKNLEKAEKLWTELGCTNIAAYEGHLRDGLAEHAPFSLILFNGAISSVPSEILDQLDENGRMLAVLAPHPGKESGKAVFIERCAGGGFSDRVLFDANTPCLPGFEPRKEFVF